jgi:uncharacterized protein (DUF3820 family)
MNNPMPDPQILLKLVSVEMPYGKYKGRKLCDIPVSYLEWMARQGFPKKTMGMYLQTIYEIKINGLENLLAPLKTKDNFNKK